MSTSTDPAEPQLSVRFTTQLEALRVTDAPIQLPIRLSRAGLSEVINHLLTGQDADHVARPFDFLLDGVLVRGPLGQALAKQGLSGEAVATLEYVECLPPPRPEQSCAHEDWLGDLAAHPGGARLLLSACFNNAAYVWDAEGRRLAELTGHTAAVKAVTWLRGGSEAAGGAVLRAASGSKDHTVRTWRMTVGGDGSAGRTVTSSECEACLVGHTASVESVASNPAGDMLCSGAWDGSVMVWAGAAGSDGGEEAPDENPSKRAKGKRGSAAATTAAPTEARPVSTLSGHQASVNALCWPTAALLYSGSWDGTIREWQVHTHRHARTRARPARSAVHTPRSLLVFLRVAAPDRPSHVAVQCPRARPLQASASEMMADIADVFAGAGGGREPERDPRRPARGNEPRRIAFGGPHRIGAHRPHTSPMGLSPSAGGPARPPAPPRVGERGQVVPPLGALARDELLRRQCAHLGRALDHPTT